MQKCVRGVLFFIFKEGIAMKFNLKIMLIVTVACMLIFALASCDEDTTTPEIKEPAEGLEFTLNNDGESYFISGIGTCTSTDIVIPDTYEGKPVTSINEYAFSGQTSLTAITIPDSVTSIGWYAFCDCTSLQSLTIGSGVTTIGEYAFRGCTSLKDVYYQGSVEDWCNIDLGGPTTNPCYYGADLYIKGELLADAVIPDGVKKIDSYAFYGCTSLASVVIPNSVTGIYDGAFSCCTSLASVTLGNGVTSIESSAFWGCSSLTNVTIPDSVTYIGDSAFQDCTSLMSVTLGNGVTNMGDFCFRNCTSLTNVTIPDGVTSINYYAFDGCTSLASVTIPSSVTYINWYAFNGCTSLASVTIGNGILNIGEGSFYRCKALTEIHYNGTREQWNAIGKGLDWNSYTGEYTIYCTDGEIGK